MSTMMRDPWLVQQADKVLADYASRAGILNGLSPDARTEVIERLRVDLYGDPKLLKVCKDERFKAVEGLRVKALRLEPFLAQMPASKAAQLRQIISMNPSEFSLERLTVYGTLIQAAYKQLREVAAAAPAAAARKVAAAAVDTKKRRTKIQQLQDQEASFDRVGYARSIGRRICAYEAAVAKNTPQSITMARFLWTELYASLAGWVNAHGPAALQGLARGAAGDKALTAFLREGYTPQGAVNAKWTTRPEVLTAWNVKAWKADPAAASRVIRWQYDAIRAVNEPGVSLRLSDAVSVFATEDEQAEALGAIFGFGSDGSSQEQSWCLRGPQMETLVPAARYYSGNLFVRLREASADKETYEGFVKAAEEAGTDLPPWSDFKSAIIDRQIGELQRYVGTSGIGWPDVAKNLTPRDPWIPVEVLSAYVSSRLQFPWASWMPLWMHDDSRIEGTYVGLERAGAGGKPWFWPCTPGNDWNARPPWEWTARPPAMLNFALGCYDSTERVPLRSSTNLMERVYYDEKERRVREGWYASPPIMHRPRKAPKIEPGAKWSRIGDLAEVTNFVPWRLEVVRLTPEADAKGRVPPSGIYAYRTYDWFPYVVERTTTYKLLEDTFRLPTESPETFKQKLIAHNGPPDDETKNPILQLIAGRDPEALVGPIWPDHSPGALNRTAYEGDDYDAPTFGPITILRVPRLIPTEMFRTDNFKKTDAPLRVECGVSTPAMLFLSYLNNDYKMLPKGLNNLLVSRNVLYRLFSGETSAASEEVLARTLYRTPWATYDGYFGPGEVPPTEADRISAEDEDYVGPYNPGLIPKLSGPASTLMPGGYLFSQGLLGRLTARRVKIPDTDDAYTRLTNYEREIGVPEVTGKLARVGNEIKRWATQRRIKDFSDAFVRTFQEFLAIPEGADEASDKRRPLRDQVLAQYNRVWAGYFSAAEYQPTLYDTQDQTRERFSVATTKITRFITRWNGGPPGADISPTEYNGAGGEWNAYPYQSDAVFRLDEQGGGLLAFDVGVGKTLTALAAVGWNKQHGRARRPVFLVPLSIKLKWWKDIRLSFPDWNIAVLGTTLRAPRSAADFDAAQKKRFGQWTGIMVAACKLAGYADADAEAAGPKSALNFIIEGGTPEEHVPSDARALLSEALKARIRGRGAEKDAKREKEAAKASRVYPAAGATWCKDSDDDTTEKLVQFAAGYYDCLLTDEYGFKGLALRKGSVQRHVLRASASRYMLWSSTFGKSGKTKFGSRFFLGRALPAMVVRILAQDAGAEEDYEATDADDGGTSRRRKAPRAQANKVEDYNAPVPGADATYNVAASPLAQRAAGVPSAPWWKSSAAAFMGKKFFPARTNSLAAAREVFDRLLVTTADGDPAPGAYIIVADVLEYEPIKVPLDRADALDRMVGAGLCAPFPFSAWGERRPWAAQSADSDGVVLSFPTVDAVDESLCDYYPDGVMIPGTTAQYGQCDYSGELYSVLPINREREGFVGGFPATVDAKTAADAAAAYINANLVDFGLGVRVKVVPRLTVKQGKKGAEDTTTLLRPPNLDVTDYSAISGEPDARKIAALRAKIPKLYYGQMDPLTPPKITWEDLGVDCLVIDEAHKFKGLFSAQFRGGKVGYLEAGQSSARAWGIEYMASVVKQAPNGQVILLTATPAKQSPLDFYNIIQLLGAAGLPADANLFNNYGIATAEQFISRFIDIQDKLVVNAKSEVSRGPAAAGFQNLGEFFAVLERYANIKTVNDAPYLRGETVAEGTQDGAPGTAPPITFASGGTIARVAGFDLKALLADVPDDKYKTLRLRIASGESAANYRIVPRSVADNRKDADGNKLPPLADSEIEISPPFPTDSTSSPLVDGDSWAIYKDSRVPLAPTPVKGMVNLSPEQADLYEQLQRATARMYIDNVRSWRIVAGGVDFEVDRASVFTRMSRVTLHPDLEYLETEAARGNEEVSSNADDDSEATTTKNAAVSDRYAYGLVAGLHPSLDPYEGAADAQALIGRQSSDDEDEDDEDEDEDEDATTKSRKSTGKGIEGSVPVPNPAYVDLRAMYRALHDSLLRALKAAVDPSMDSYAQDAAERAARREWNALPSVLGPRPASTKKGAALVPSTNGADYGKLVGLFDASVPAQERVKALSGLYNTEQQEWFQATGKASALKPLTSAKAADVLAMKVRGISPIPTINPQSSRTLYIADRIVSQNLTDAKAPVMGDVTCGHLVFGDNLFYQAWQVLTNCRLAGLAHAAACELAAYRAANLPSLEAGGDERAHAAAMLSILRYYGIGAWGAYLTTRAVLMRVFPEAAAEVAQGSEDADPLRPIVGNDFSANPLIRAVQGALVTVWKLWSTERYGTAREDVEFFNFLVRKELPLVPRATFDGARIATVYASAWARTANRTCVMNAPMSGSGVREILAQKFNGEYEQVEEDGKIVQRILRAPEYDTVIANVVAYEGIDLQVRTCRVIHADLPWTSADFTQRNGRAVRQGNLYDEVEIVVVLSEGTVDFYRLQGIERKKAWMESAMDSKDSTYDLSNDEAELLRLAVLAVLEEDRPAVEAIVGRLLQAIQSEQITRYYGKVLGDLTAALARLRKFWLLNAVPSDAYRQSALSNMREGVQALASAAAPGGSGVGGAQIYGRSFRPSYFDVCLGALGRDLGGGGTAPAWARTNPFPNPGEPRSESPSPPIVQGTLIGCFVPEGAVYGGLRAMRPFTENEAGRNFAYLDPATDTWKRAAFVPFAWVGRFGPRSLDGSRAAAANVGILPIYKKMERSASENSTPLLLPDAGAVWRAVGAFDFKEFARAFDPYSKLAGARDVNTSGFTLRNWSALVPATYSEVLAYIDGVKSTAGGYGPPAGSQIPQSSVVDAVSGTLKEGLSMLGYVHPDWIAANEAAVRKGVQRVLRESPGRAEHVYLPFVIGEKLAVVKGSRLMYGDANAKARWQFIEAPAEAQAMLARGEALPDPDTAAKMVEATEAQEAAAKEALREAKKGVTAANNEHKKWKERVATWGGEKLDEAKTALAAANEAGKSALDTVAYLTETMPDVPLPPELQAKAKAAQDAVDKAEAAVVKVKAKVAEASAAADTAEAEWVAAEEAQAEAEAAKTLAERAVEKAKKLVTLAEAAETRLILPTVEGYREFITLARESEFAFAASLKPGTLALAAAQGVFDTWFTGDPSPSTAANTPHVEWWGSAQFPTPFYASYEQAQIAKRQGGREDDGGETGSLLSSFRRKGLDALGTKTRKIETIKVGDLPPFPLVRAGVLRVGDLFFAPEDEPIIVYRVVSSPTYDGPVGAKRAGFDAVAVAQMDPEDGTYDIAAPGSQPLVNMDLGINDALAKTAIPGL